jgi:hypothetical protein
MRYVAVVALIALSFAGCNKPAEQAASSPPVAEQADASAPGPQHGMVMSTTIVITNSGSTNTIGWRILIGATGDASYVSGDGAGNATLPADLYAKLKGDIEAAKPLGQLPSVVSCMKSASFGTATYLSIGGDRSPDLECPGNDPERALKTDIDAIVTVLKLRNTPKSEGKELPPQNY